MEEEDRVAPNLRTFRAPVAAPVGYFPADDPTRPPPNRWRSHGHLLYGNWINWIYQTTPFDLTAIGRM